MAKKNSPVGERSPRHKNLAVKLLAYKRPALPTEQRVRDLLKRMTLAEKAAQMKYVWQEKARKLVDAEGGFEPGNL